jgi:hypothetical protein
MPTDSRATLSRLLTLRLFKCKQDTWSSRTVAYSLMKDDVVESMFPNVEVDLRTYLSSMVSNCNCSEEIILTLEASGSSKPVNHIARQAELFIALKLMTKYATARPSL